MRHTSATEQARDTRIRGDAIEHLHRIMLNDQEDTERRYRAAVNILQQTTAGERAAHGAAGVAERLRDHQRRTGPTRYA